MAGVLAENLALARQYTSVLTADCQAYLIFQGIDHVTISSNNHASPTGALPFLLPASSYKNPGEAVLPVPSTRIERWTREKNPSEEKAGRSSGEARGEAYQHAQVDTLTTDQKTTSGLPSHPRYEAYMSLINYRIRNAYVDLTLPTH